MAGTWWNNERTTSGPVGVGRFLLNTLQLLTFALRFT